MVADKEIRFLQTKVELMAAEDGQGGDFIEGYALKFERWSDVLGFFFPFREIISQNSLDNCDMSNVVALFNHDQSYPLARNTVQGDIGSLALTIDNIGLKFRFRPTGTSYAQDLIENVRAGVINQCSFAFSIDPNDDSADEWTYNETDGIYERRINRIAKLYDVSIVTTPAYPDTEAVVGQRSREKIKKLEKLRLKPKVDEEKEKLMLELDLLSI